MLASYNNDVQPPEDTILLEINIGKKKTTNSGFLKAKSYYFCCKKQGKDYNSIAEKYNS